MSALRSLLAVSAILGGFVASAEAQGVVPGGWAPQVGYQTFSNPGIGGAGAFAGGGPNFGGGPNLGGGLVGGFGPMGGGVGIPSFGFNQGITPTGYGFVPSGFQNDVYGMGPAIRQTTVATDPLMNAIQQSTRRSRRR